MVRIKESDSSEVMKQRSSQNFLSFRSRRHSRVVDDQGTWLELTKLERRLYGMHRPAGLESRFQASSKEVLTTTLEYIKKRAREIARANPWVHGRIRNHPRSRKLSLFIPKSRSAGQSEFFEEEDLLRIIYVDDTDLGRFADQDTHDLIAAEANCDTGEDCLLNQTPIVKLTIFLTTEPDTTEFLLTLSLCHQISDATALYELWGMLQEGSEIRALDVHRYANYKGHWLTAMKGQFSQRKLLFSLFNTEASPLFRKKRQSIDRTKLVRFFHVIRPEWVEQQKKMHTPTPDVPYLSTQDVFTSWFMTSFQPSCGALVVNLRGRVKTPITTDHVGNYLDLLVLYPEEYRDPAQIRRLILTMGAAAQGSKNNRPGRTNHLLGTISCWHSLYQELQFAGCTRHTHLLLRGGMFCMEMHNNAPNSRMALAMIRISATEVAVVGFAPPANVVRLVRNDSVVGLRPPPPEASSAFAVQRTTPIGRKLVR